MRKNKSKNRDNDLNIEKNFSIESCNHQPKNMSSNFNRKPYIYLGFSNDIKDIDLYSVRMFIDNKVVSAEVNSKGVGYSPRKEMDFGKHNVEVKFKLSDGEEGYIQWFFLLEKREAKYKFYFGNLHSHTSYSGGMGLPKDAYNHARKKSLDFLAITDHSKRLKGKGTIKNKKHLKDVREFDKWDASRYEAELLNKKHKKFLPLVGFELSTQFWGHLNIYNTSNYPDRKIKSLDMLYKWLNDKKNIIVGINHPNDRTSRIKYLKELDQFVNLIEVGNGAPPYKYVRSEGIYFKLLDDGWHLGAVNGQDNHKDNWGDNDNLTVVIAEKLTEKVFINALLSRRVYSTESRSLKLIVKANGHWMGSILNLSKDKNISFEINADDKKNPIRKIQIISNGARIIKEKEFNGSKKVKWNYTVESSNENTWYVVKVIHENDKWGISSAVFI